MQKKRILIIDDEPDVITYLTAVLEANGYDSFAVSEIKNAMDKVREIRPNLICLDIVMPGETGISFYSRLRQEKIFDSIPVIIISGMVETEKFNFHSYISDDSVSKPECYIEKPINVDYFIQKVEELTRKKVLTKK